jgi:hypothetical protein
VQRDHRGTYGVVVEQRVDDRRPLSHRMPSTANAGARTSVSTLDRAVHVAHADRARSCDAHELRAIDRSTWLSTASWPSIRRRRHRRCRARTRRDRTSRASTIVVRSDESARGGLVGLAGIDGGVGRSVDHGIRTNRRQHVAHRHGVGDVERRPIDGDDIVALDVQCSVSSARRALQVIGRSPPAGRRPRCVPSCGAECRCQPRR